MTHGIFGLLLAFAVGLVLGLLGGGGSILAVPIFLYVFQIPTDSAMAMSLPVVSTSALVGFLVHWRQGSVNLPVGLPFALCAALAGFITSHWAKDVPEWIRLSLFAAFALSAAIIMLRDSLHQSPPPATVAGDRDAIPAHFSPSLAVAALCVGVLTSIIGAGGGFIIVPVLVYVARVPVREAVGSSLLVITANAFTSFLGNVGQVAIDWRLVLWFTAVAALGTITGSRLNRRVPQRRIKQAFAVLIIVLWMVAIGRYLLGH